MAALGLSFLALGPAAASALGAMTVLIVEVILRRMQSDATRSTLAERRAGLLLVGLATVFLLATLGMALGAVVDSAAASVIPPNAALRLDGLAAASIALVTVGALLCLWLSSTYLAALHIDHGGYYVRRLQ